MERKKSSTVKGDWSRVKNMDSYRDSHDRIFKKISCDICGRYISYNELESGKAQRNLITPDSDYSTEDYETYHVECNKQNVKKT